MANRKLLLADDSATIQKVVNLTFADIGIDVITVGDGDTALGLIESEAPDIVLADVNMPGLTGYEICESVRSNPATSGLPVILLVGSFEPFDHDEAERVGASSFVTKPFQSIRHLMAQVNDLLDAVPDTNGNGADSPHVDLSSENVPDEMSGDTLDFRPSSRAVDDIESLYKQSFARPAQDNDGTSRYPDSGIDDELIETSYADRVASPGDADDVSNIGNFEDSDYDEEADDFGALHEEGYASAAQEKSEEDPTGSVPQESEESSWETNQYDRAYSAANITGTDDTSDEIDDDNLAPVSAPKQELPTASDALSPFDEIAEPKTLEFLTPLVDTVQFEEELFGEETSDADNGHDQGKTVEFDPIDLLELPGFPEEIQPVEFTTPSDSISKDSRAQVVSLSPELMEILVQRVLERLAQKGEND